MFTGVSNMADAGGFACVRAGKENISSTDIARAINRDRHSRLVKNSHVPGLLFNGDHIELINQAALLRNWGLVP